MNKKILILVLVSNLFVVFGEKWTPKKMTVYDEFDNVIRQYIYQYDKDGNKIRTAGIKDKNITYFNSKFDKYGNEIEKRTNNMLDYTVKIEYGKNKKKIKETFYSDVNEPYEINVYEYDSKGNEVKITTYNAVDNSITGERTFEYDSKGKVKKELHKYFYSDETSLFETIYEENKKSTYKDGVLYWEDLQEHDEKGNIVKAIFKDIIKGPIEIFIYEY